MNVAVKVFHNDTWAEALMLMYGVRGERRRIDERKQRGSKRQVRKEEEKEQVEKRDFGDEATNHGEASLVRGGGGVNRNMSQGEIPETKRLSP